MLTPSTDGYKTQPPQKPRQPRDIFEENLKRSYWRRWKIRFVWNFQCGQAKMFAARGRGGRSEHRSLWRIKRRDRHASTSPTTSPQSPTTPTTTSSEVDKLKSQWIGGKWFETRVDWWFRQNPEDVKKSVIVLFGYFCGHRSHRPCALSPVVWDSDERSFFSCSVGYFSCMGKARASVCACTNVRTRYHRLIAFHISTNMSQGFENTISLW